MTSMDPTPGERLPSFPLVVPSFFAGPFCLRPCVFDGHALPYATLQHGILVQSPLIDASRHAVVTHCSERLAGGAHAVVLALQLQFPGFSLFPLEELPCSMDGPMAKVAQAREAKRPGVFWVLEEVADESCQTLNRSLRRR